MDVHQTLKPLDRAMAMTEGEAWVFAGAIVSLMLAATFVLLPWSL